MAGDSAPLIATPIDLALRSLPAPETSPGTVITVEGCALTVDGSARARPSAPETPPCEALWSQLLAWELDLDALAPDGTIAWSYRLTRDHVREDVPRAVNIRFDGDTFRVEPLAGELKLLACHDARTWRIAQLEHTASGLIASRPEQVKEMRRLPGCEASIVDSGTSYFVPVYQEVTLEFLFINALILLWAAGPLAIVLGLLVRHLFRRRVERTLNTIVAASAPPPNGEAHTATSIPLRFTPLGPGRRGPLATDTFARMRRSTLVYGVASLIASAIVGVASLIESATPEKGFGGAVLWTALSAWPIIPVLASVAPIRRRSILAAVIAYVLGCTAVAAFLGVGFMNAMHLFPSQIVGVCVITLVVASPFRHLGPWIFVATWVALVGLVSPFFLAQGPEGPLLRSFGRFAAALGVESAWTGVIGATLIALLVVLILLWIALRLLARAYVHFRLSDRFVIVGSIWTLYVLIVCASILNWGGDRVILWSLSSLPIALAVVLIALRPKRADPIRRLLFLRTFAGRPGQIDIFGRLRELLANDFRIELIAGPDLATHLVQPFELLDFIAGKGARTYLQAGDDLDARLHVPAEARDADGLLRTRQFFCANSIWKDVFARLAAGADVVLIDLRGLYEKRAGTEYELTQLIQKVALDRVIALVDPGNRGYVERVALAAWAKLPASSPNLGLTDAALQIFEHDPKGPRELVRLVEHIASVVES